MPIFLLGFSTFVAAGWGEQSQLEGELSFQGSVRVSPGLCGAQQSRAAAAPTLSPVPHGLAPGCAGMELWNLPCPGSSLLGSCCPIPARDEESGCLLHGLQHRGISAHHFSTLCFENNLEILFYMFYMIFGVVFFFSGTILNCTRKKKAKKQQ